MSVTVAELAIGVTRPKSHGAVVIYDRRACRHVVVLRLTSTKRKCAGCGATRYVKGGVRGNWNYSKVK